MSHTQTAYDTAKQSIILPICKTLYDPKTEKYDISDAFQKRCTTPINFNTMIYHGTSAWRFRQYSKIEDIEIIPSDIGHKFISFTTNEKVAHYWTKVSVGVDMDQYELPEDMCQSMIFSFTIGDLIGAGISLYHYSDTQMGGPLGTYDYEDEICTDKRIRISDIKRATVSIGDVVWTKTS